MSERVKRQWLDNRLEHLNTVLGLPVAPYIKVGDRYVAQVGNIHLDHNIGGYAIEQMGNESGGISQPFGSGRHTGRGIMDMLEAAITGAKMMKSAQANNT